MSVSHLIIPLSKACTVPKNSTLGDAVIKLNQNRIGLIIITTNNNTKLHSILTEGDIRRLLTSGQKSFSQLMGEPIIKFSNKEPIAVSSNTSVKDLIVCMCKHKIWDIPIVEEDNSLRGIVHMHDAVESFSQFEK